MGNLNRFSNPAVCFGCGVALTVVLLLCFAYHGYPVPVEDPDVFSIPAVNYAQGEGLTNETWFGEYTILKADGKYVHHGFLYPVLLGAVMKSLHLTSAAIPTILPLLAVFMTLFSAGLFYRECRRSEGRFGWLDTAVCLSAVWAQDALMLTKEGRPELLALPIVTAAAWGALRFPRFDAIIAALGIALAAATSPFAGLHFGLICTVYTLLKSETQRPIAKALVTLGLSLLFFRLSFALLYPHPFSLWLQGTLVLLANSAQIDVSAPPFSSWIQGPLLHGEAGTGFVRHFTFYDYVKGLLLSPGDPGFVLPLLFTLWAFRGALQTAKQKVGKLRFWLAAGVSAILLLSIAHFSISDPYKHYNLLPFITLMVLAILAYGRSSAGRLYEKLAGLGFAAMSLGLLRTAILFSIYLSSGMSLRDARQSLSQTGFDKDGLTGIDVHVLCLTDNLKSLRILCTADPNAGMWSYHALVKCQQNSGMLQPPEYAGFELIADHFRREPPRFLGIRVGNTIPGYAFAVYRAKPASGAKP